MISIIIIVCIVIVITTIITVVVIIITFTLKAQERQGFELLESFYCETLQEVRFNCTLTTIDCRLND